IRDFHVTGVQTCALPISLGAHFRVLDDAGAACRASAPLRLTSPPAELRLRLSFECVEQPARYVVTPWPVPGHHHLAHVEGSGREIGRASCRESGELGGAH